MKVNRNTAWTFRQVLQIVDAQRDTSMTSSPISLGICNSSTSFYSPFIYPPLPPLTTSQLFAQ